MWHCRPCPTCRCPRYWAAGPLGFGEADTSGGAQLGRTWGVAGLGLSWRERKVVRAVGLGGICPELELTPQNGGGQPGAPGDSVRTMLTAAW